MSKIKKIITASNFKSENIKNWEKVSDFWLSGDLSQKIDLIDFYKIKLSQFINTETIRILDVGCGEGWMLDIIRSLDNFKFEYVGIDYNTNFISF